MATRPQFDNKISLGTVVTVITVLAGGVAAIAVDRDRQRSLEREVTEIQTSVGGAVSRLERKIDTDLDRVSSVVEKVDDKVDQVISEQTTSALRLSTVEREQDELDDRLGATRTVAIQVQSNANRDRAVQAERHETLLGAINELKQALRGGD